MLAYVFIEYPAYKLKQWYGHRFEQGIGRFDFRIFLDKLIFIYIEVVIMNLAFSSAPTPFKLQKALVIQIGSAEVIRLGTILSV